MTFQWPCVIVGDVNDVISSIAYILAWHAKSECNFQYILLPEVNGKNNAHYMLQLVYAAIEQYVRIFKVQYRTANCHYYKNVPCNMKCV